jgi:peptidoglycan/xylan/chitin deacetylase (PgdA/CDA1 family)
MAMSSNMIALMYHGIGSPAPHGEAHYTVSDALFEAQLNWLGQRQCVVPFHLLIAGKVNKDVIVLTFDDGEKSVVTRALPLMRKRAMTGALFITTDWIGKPGYVSKSDILELNQEGWTIGAHGATHRFLPDLTQKELMTELRRSRKNQTNILGTPPHAPELLTCPYILVSGFFVLYIY